jgi:hypothetical protein
MVLTLSALAVYNLNAQEKFSLSGGWGYYELVNLGLHWNISETSSIRASAGTNFNFSDEKEFSAGLSFEHAYRKPVVWKIRSGYSIGTIFWTHDDDLYTFRNLSFPFMALLDYNLTRTLIVRAEGGIILNTTLVSERKQNVEAGYPDRLNGNVRISLICKLGSR